MRAVIHVGEQDGVVAAIKPPSCVDGDGHDDIRFERGDWHDDRKGDWPLAAAMEKWHESLPAPLVLALRERLQGLAPTVSVGTACSGSDISILLLQWMSEHWAEHFGVKVRFQQRFACESNKEIQQFLERNFPECETIITDTMHLVFDWAPTSQGKTSPLIKVPSTDLFLAGFVCKARSKFNGQRQKNKGCVQKSEASTGQSFAQISAYVKKHRLAELSWRTCRISPKPSRTVYRMLIGSASGSGRTTTPSYNCASTRGSTDLCLVESAFTGSRSTEARTIKLEERPC